MPNPSPAILYVDDDEGSRRLTAEFLRQAGFEVWEAGTAAEALGRLADRPEVVLLDVRLPDLSGFEVCRRLRADPASAATPVLHLSGAARSTDDKVHGLEGGADGYLLKPVEPAELLAQVRALLRLRRAEAALRDSEERLCLVMHSAYDAFVSIDAGGLITDWNRQAEHTFGWPREEALGRLLAELVIPARFRARHQAGLTRLLQAGESPVLNSLLEVTALHRDGHEFPAELTISRVRWRDSYLFNAFVRDVSARRRAERHQAVQQAVSQALVESGSLGEATRRVLRAVCDLTGWDAGAVWRVDRSANVLRRVETWSAAHLDAAEFEAQTKRLAPAPGEGLPGRVWASRRPAALGELAAELSQPRAAAAARAGLRGAFASPVPFGLEVTGVIEFFSRDARPPDDLLALLGAPTGQIGQFLERKRAEEAREEQARLAVFSADVAHALALAPNLEGMLQRCAEAVVRHLGAAFARVGTLDEAEDVLVLRASAGLYTHTDGAHARIPVGHLKVGHIARTRQPLLINDVANDAHVSDPDWARREGMAAFAGHPLLIGDELVGVMALFSREPLSEFTLQALASAADSIAVGIQRRRAEEGLRAREQESRIARRIQARLFPGRELFMSGFDIGGASYPAEATGGDYFDYIPLCDGALAVAVGDVSGHGLGPALLMASTRAYLRALALVHGDVGRMLALANRVLHEDTTDEFVTLLLARLDPRDHTLVYASAGHPPGYVLDGEGRLRRRLVSTAPPLGLFPDAAFPVAEPVALGPGDFVLFVTDGVSDAQAPDGTAFGTGRALSVARVYRRDPAGQIVANLYGAVRAFTQGAPQRDDVSAVVIKRKGPG